MILNSPGNQILLNLSSDDYEKVVKVLEDAILSTDLAVYFRYRYYLFRTNLVDLRELRLLKFGFFCKVTNKKI